MTSSSNHRRVKSSRKGDRSKSSSVQVKCNHCGNTFRAQARLAVCAKCGRPANRPLKKFWLVASFFFPVVGFLNSFMIRPHSPLASNHGLIASIIGSAIYLVIFVIFDIFLEIF
jgi:ribosomal protein L37E